MIGRLDVWQEKRRAERAEQQRVRAEKEKERQARREVWPFSSAGLNYNNTPSFHGNIWKKSFQLLNVRL